MAIERENIVPVMLEEEMGLTLGSCEHPLKLAVFAGLGSLLSALIIITALYFGNYLALLMTSFASILIFSYCSARNEQNTPLPAIIWNIKSEFR